MARLKVEVGQVNMSTVCDKRELNLDLRGPRLRYGQVAQLILEEAGSALLRNVRNSLHPQAPAAAGEEV
jgi:hypothetical protein